MAFSRLMERQTLRNVSKGSGGVIVLDMGDFSFLFVGIGIKNRSDLFPVFFCRKEKNPACWSSRPGSQLRNMSPFQGCIYGRGFQGLHPPWVCCL